MPRHKLERPITDDGWTEWVQPISNGYRMSCCDCGLVHELDFRIVSSSASEESDRTNSAAYEGRVQFRARRHERSTAAVRAHRRRREAVVSVPAQATEDSNND